MDSTRGAGLAALTALTLVAFAANSLLCRMALGARLIDPVSFTTLRLTSGALVLVVLARSARRGAASDKASLDDRGSWASGLALFAYAMAFSLAYTWLDTGVGALLLFGGVQVTMIGAGVLAGERPSWLEWLGLGAALVGLVWLVAPGLSAPHPAGAALMAISGVAWGIYSLRGRRSRAPVPTTAGNFARAAPMALTVSLVSALMAPHLTLKGAGLALLSGVVTSGMGYVLWYRVLRSLTATRAAIVQLAVPVLAAVAGVVVLSETPTARLAVSSVLILGGVAVAVMKRSRS